MKDLLKWKLGLRNELKINVSKLGLRFIDLSRNILGTKSGIQIAHVLKSDEYLRGIALKKNKIGTNGILSLIETAN